MTEHPPSVGDGPDPLTWDQLIFRETFLHEIESPKLRMVMREFGVVIVGTVRKLAAERDPHEACTEVDAIRAAAADLRHVEQFLAAFSSSGDDAPRGAAYLNWAPLTEQLTKALEVVASSLDHAAEKRARRVEDAPNSQGFAEPASRPGDDETSRDG